MAAEIEFTRDQWARALRLIELGESSITRSGRTPSGWPSHITRPGDDLTFTLDPGIPVTYVEAARSGEARTSEQRERRGTARFLVISPVWIKVVVLERGTNNRSGGAAVAIDAISHIEQAL